MRVMLNSVALHAYLREERISRDELARRMGVTGATAYRCDSGRTEPSSRFIAAVIGETGMRFEELFEVV